MIRRVLDTIAVTVSVALAGGAVMLGSALAPHDEAADLEASAVAAEPIGLVSWAVHAAPPALAAAPAGIPLALDDCRHEAERRVSIAVDGADLLRVESGSGLLRVDGRPGLTDVRAVARLCASERDYLDDMNVTLERRGGTLELRTHYPENRDRVRWGEDYARIELVVEAPQGFGADVTDGSGEMELNDLGPVTIDDGSGEIRVARAAGDVRIEDGSGSIDLRDIRGSVEIEDGSGGVEIDGVTGLVDLRDGSGGISIRNVGADVHVRDGSGSIDVMDVRGDFVVSDDGSGSIDWSGVSGRVDVPSRHRQRGRRIGS